MTIREQVLDALQCSEQVAVTQGRMYSAADMARICGCKRGSASAVLRELEHQGYLIRGIRSVSRNGGGNYEAVYRAR